MERKRKVTSPYFSLQLIIGLILIVMQLFTFSTFYNEYRLSGYNSVYTRFIWYHGVFLFFSLFLCYPDSLVIRYLQIVYCLAYSTIGIVITYAGNGVDIAEIGLLFLAGILYWRYEMPHRSIFHILLVIFCLFLVLFRSYILGHEMNLGYCLIYSLLAIAVGFDRQEIIGRSQRTKSMIATSADKEPRPGTSGQQEIVDYLSSVPECKVFTEFELQLMAEYYCTNGNATNKELASALSASDSRIKNSISSIFKKVPEIHSRVGMLRFVQQQVFFNSLPEKQTQESAEKNPDGNSVKF